MAKVLPFRTPMSERKIVYSNPGSHIEEIMAMRLDKDGTEEFYVKGTTNVYEKIQMFKDDCDIEKLLIQVTQTGDLSLLNKRDPFYMDVSDMPDNIFEAQQKIKEAEQKFEELPLSIKEKYNMDFNQYLADFGSENWLKNMGLTKSEEEKKEPEEKEKGETTE